MTVLCGVKEMLVYCISGTFILKNLVINTGEQQLWGSFKGFRFIETTVIE